MRQETAMPVFVDQDGGSCVVRCEGEIDIALAAEVKEALLGAVARGLAAGGSSGSDGGSHSGAAVGVGGWA